MSGKFNNISNGICNAYYFIVFPAIMIGGAVLAVRSGSPEIGTVILVFLVVPTMLLPPFLLRKCEFSADDEKVVFRVVFLKRTYCFSEIKSASSQVGFSHGKYGASARVELVITLSNGERVTFYDDDVPDEALSTPKTHKKFQDAHQFTALCQYINERAGG